MLCFKYVLCLNIVGQSVHQYKKLYSLDKNCDNFTAYKKHYYDAYEAP